MAILLDTNGKDRIIADGYILENLKNQIINGGFEVNQRAKSGTVVLTAGQYGHDRWKAGASGCTYTFATVENITTITITAGSLIQVIEGINLETGTYVLSWEGTAQGKIGAGSYSSSGITGTVVGGTNLNIEFGTGTISKVRFNRGLTPVEWQTEAYADVLEQCMRYYPRFEASGGFVYINGHGLFVTTASANIAIEFEVETRIAPTSVEYSNVHISDSYSAGHLVSSIALNSSTKKGVFMMMSESGVTMTIGRPAVLYTHSGGGYIAFNCEL